MNKELNLGIEKVDGFYDFELALLTIRQLCCDAIASLLFNYSGEVDCSEIENPPVIRINIRDRAVLKIYILNGQVSVSVDGNGYADDFDVKLEDLNMDDLVALYEFIENEVRESKQEIFDANGATLELGMEVYVPEPGIDDVHTDPFEGVIIGLKGSTVIVADNDGFAYQIEGKRVVSDDNNSDDENAFELQVQKQSHLVLDYDPTLYATYVRHLK